MQQVEVQEQGWEDGQFRTVATMIAAIRKMLSYSLTYFDRRHSESSANDSRLGEYRVDYTMPSCEELQAADPKLEELFANSKAISAKDQAR